MATYEITVDEQLLQQVFTGTDEGRASLIQQVLNQVLEGPCTEQLPADRYERSEDRQGYRNGTYSRSMRTRVDILEEDDDLVVECELPGIKKDDIDISVDDHQLTIQGGRRREKNGRGRGTKVHAFREDLRQL